MERVSRVLEGEAAALLAAPGAGLRLDESWGRLSGRRCEARCSGESRGEDPEAGIHVEVYLIPGSASPPTGELDPPAWLSDREGVHRCASARIVHRSGNPSGAIPAPQPTRPRSRALGISTTGGAQSSYSSTDPKPSEAARKTTASRACPGNSRAQVPARAKRGAAIVGSFGAPPGPRPRTRADRLPPPG